jgi:hypothetical protein
LLLGDIQVASIEVRTVWQVNNAAVAREVESLWEELSAVYSRDRAERLKELVAAAYVDGEVAGALTARPIDYKVLRAQVFHLRPVLRPDAHHDEVLFQLLSAAKSVLQPWARADSGGRMKGLLVMFDSDAYDGLYAEPVIRRSGVELVLTGCTDEGRQIRMLWFDDARLEK